MKWSYFARFSCIVLFCFLTIIPSEAEDEYIEEVLAADEDFCNPNPCKNGAECLKSLKKCSCASGYSGVYCEKCKCENGFCTENDKGMSVCTCPPEWGLYSNTKCKECKCGKDSNCTFESGWFTSSKKCLCKVGFEDKDGFCKGTCKTNPCQNGGECVVKGDGIECKCKEPFSGELCDEEVIETTTLKVTTSEPTLVPSTSKEPDPTANFSKSTTGVEDHSTTITSHFTTEDATTGTAKRTSASPVIFSTTGASSTDASTTISEARTSVVSVTPTEGYTTTVSGETDNTTASGTELTASVTSRTTDGLVTATGNNTESTTEVDDSNTTLSSNFTTRFTTVSESGSSETGSTTTFKENGTTSEPLTTTTAKVTTENSSIAASTETDSTSKEPGTTTDLWTPGTTNQTSTITTAISTEDLTSTTENATTSETPITTHIVVSVTPTEGNTTTETDNTTASGTESTSSLTSNTTDEYVTLTANNTEGTTEVDDSNTTLSSNFTTRFTTVSDGGSTETGSTTTFMENGTTPKSDDICSDNPCKNGGTCIITEDGQNCSCVYPYGGNNCTDSYWCSEGLGRVLCGKTNCVFDFKTRVGRCSCQKGEFYDYSKRICQTVDKCPLTPDKCKGANEVCENNACICLRNFTRNEKKECVPNFCDSLNMECGHNATCEENPSDPENVKCVCKENEVYNGDYCLRVNKCDVPSLLGCQQICNASTEICECFDGYSLQEDKKSCKSDTNDTKCTKDCKPGICHKDGKSETCICPPTHVYKDGACKDLCTAKNVPADLCPGNVCEPHPTLGFRCKCDGVLTYDKTNVTCRRKLMCSEGNGLEVCSNKSAKCVEDLDSKYGFRCECAQDKEMDNDGICKSMCDLKEYQEECLRIGAVCEVQSNDTNCKCPPMFTFSDRGWCEELAASYTGSIPFVKDKYAVKTFYAPGEFSLALDYSKMRRDLRNSMRLLYGSNYRFADILSCRDSASSLACTVEVQFESEPRDQVKLVGDPGTCISDGPDTCFIPPELVLWKKEVTPELLSPTDPCMDRFKIPNCGEKETVCSRLSNDSSSFECACNEGFSSFGITYPANDPMTIIHRCEDIDECLVPGICPNTTSCLNTFGSYECLCQAGFRLLDAKDNPKATGCVEVCHSVSCGNGKCEADGSYYRCNCEDGYSGANCDKQVQSGENPKGAVVALITLSTIVIPLVLFSLYMIHKYRILRKSTRGSVYLDDNTSTLSMEPLREGLT